MKTTINTETTSLRFYMRELYDPFEIKCSSFYNEKIKDELINWALARGNFKTREAALHTIECNCVYWGALCFPFTISMEKFCTISKYFQLFTINDDHAEEPWGDGSNNVEATKKYWKRAIALLETLRDNTPWHKKLLRNISMATAARPYQRAIFDYMKKILDSQSPTIRNRYINRFKEYIEGASVQIQMQGKEKELDLQTYKAYRINSLASIPCTLMIEYLYDVEMTDEEYYHPNVQELERLCTWQVALVNDLFSLFKECKHGTLENVNNIIAIMVSNGKMNLQEAVEEVCSQIEWSRHEYIRVKDKWYNSGENISKAVRTFINGMEYYMSGNSYWHRQSKRYHGRNWEGVITTGYMEWSSEGTVYHKENEQNPDIIIHKFAEMIE
ncbi:terpene synthase family protein [Parapedobacter tibetensis]|uniref:terpene synthase family protein n=1 Tax=Parapedobacter tibetensis TaxID=2972951 RepID=UPI00214D6B09|nr:terpene synthase family protein [Parapedobacter tibetensis]